MQVTITSINMLAPLTGRLFMLARAGLLAGLAAKAKPLVWAGWAGWLVGWLGWLPGLVYGRLVTPVSLRRIGANSDVTVRLSLTPVVSLGCLWLVG